MARNDYFSVGKLKVGGIEIRVRYRSRCVDDVFSTTEKAEQLPLASTMDSFVSQKDLLLQKRYDEGSRQGASEVRYDPFVGTTDVEWVSVLPG